ncbi:MAG: hypothetical protein ACO3NK_05235 [Prochlorotrichaceae cyanobacterium]|jgi:hypothetical protein
MIQWEYRVFEEEDGDFTIREVFYNEAGNIIGCTADPVEPYGTTLEALSQCLQDFQKALTLPVLCLADIPIGQPPASVPTADTFTSQTIRQKLGLETPSPV